MKRLLIAFALTILPLAAFGQSADRDALLTTDGTVYTVESIFTTPGDAKIHSTRYLSLTIQKGNDTKSTVVPSTDQSGSHVEPSLAYDNDTNTLFIFWEAARGGALATDLAFLWYRDGTWGKTTTLDSVDWDLRSNLRIALTRKTQTTAKDGSITTMPEITVHAVWWEEGRISQWARYAMITIDHGDVVVDDVRNLTDFVSAPASVLDTPSNREVLRHPAIFESSNHDSVDAVFGDPRTDKIHRVTIRPVEQGFKIRVPIGKGRDLPTPTATISSQNVGAISTGDDNLAYYFSTGDSMKYLLLQNGKWTETRSVAVGDHLSGDAAVNLLRRLLSSE